MPGGPSAIPDSPAWRAPVPGTGVPKTSGCKNQQRLCPDEKGGCYRPRHPLKGPEHRLTHEHSPSALVKGQHSKSTKGGTELSGFRVRVEQAPLYRTEGLAGTIIPLLSPHRPSLNMQVGAKSKISIKWLTSGIPL